MTKDENFSDAFDCGVGSCRGVCACGKEYYDTANGILEEHEIIELQDNPNSVSIDWSVGFIEFEGQTFVRECNCWRERSLRLMRFIDGHAKQIVVYLNKERERCIAEAERMPVIDDQPPHGGKEG